MSQTKKKLKRLFADPSTGHAAGFEARDLSRAAKDVDLRPSMDAPRADDVRPLEDSTRRSASDRPPITSPDAHETFEHNSTQTPVNHRSFERSTAVRPPNSPVCEARPSTRPGDMTSGPSTRPLGVTSAENSAVQTYSAQAAFESWKRQRDARKVRPGVVAPPLESPEAPRDEQPSERLNRTGEQPPVGVNTADARPQQRPKNTGCSAAPAEQPRRTALVSLRPTASPTNTESARASHAPAATTPKTDAHRLVQILAYKQQSTPAARATALEALDATTLRQGDHIRLLRELAQCYTQLERWDDARLSLHALTECAPLDPWPCVELATLYSRVLLDDAAALRWADNALRIAPWHNEARLVSARLRAKSHLH